MPALATTVCVLLVFFPALFIWTFATFPFLSRKYRYPFSLFTPVLAKVQMKRAGKKTSKAQTVVAKAGISRKSGYLYYIDRQGNVCEAKMQRGGKRRKKR